MAKTSEQIGKQLAFITKAGAKLDGYIQEAAIDVLEHFMEHKDSRMVDKLYLSLSKGARHAAMGEYILAHFAVIPNTDAAGKKERPFVICPDKVNKLEEAKALFWFNFKPSPAVDQLFDLQAAVRALLKKAGNSACMVGGDQGSLAKLALAAGLPASDVPTVKVAGTKAEAEKMIAEAKA